MRNALRVDTQTRSHVFLSLRMADKKPVYPSGGDGGGIARPLPGGGLPALGRALQFADLVEAGGGRLLQPTSYVSNINGFNEIFERTMRTHGESPTFFFLL